VVGVTAVDGAQRIWRRATQGPHVDFAAIGVKVNVAGAEWTGTSLATPVVAGLLARGASLEALTRAARDLGAPGRDPVFGFGLVSGS
jgi:minor extracellular protease Epr